VPSEAPPVKVEEMIKAWQFGHRTNMSDNCVCIKYQGCHRLSDIIGFRTWYSVGARVRKHDIFLPSGFLNYI
jgi:hypothetical protein